MAYQYTCGTCGFQVRSEDDDEVVDYVQKHADVMHDLHLPRSQVAESWETVTLERRD